MVPKLYVNSWLPFETLLVGAYGYLKGTYPDRVLGLWKNDKFSNDTMAVFQKIQNKTFKHFDDQKWLRISVQNDGYFTLQNQLSGKYLTARSESMITVEGKLF